MTKKILKRRYASESIQMVAEPMLREKLAYTEATA